MDAEAETGPEAVNVAIRRGESGRGRSRVEKIPGAGEARAAGFQESNFSESGPSEIFGERQKQHISVSGNQILGTALDKFLLMDTAKSEFLDFLPK